MTVIGAVDEERRARSQVTGLLALGTAGIIAAVALAAGTEAWASVAESAAVPLAFLVAGALGSRARPDHLGVRLLVLVGTGHLLAIALVGWAAVLPGPTAGRWAIALVGDTVYLAGFAALAALLAFYPTGRPSGRVSRWFLAGTIGIDLVVLLDETLLHARLPLDAGVGATSVAAPMPLPLLATGFDPIVLALLPVPAAVVLLTAGRRRRTDSERQAIGWALLGGVVLVLLLAVSPVLDRLAPGANDVVFPVVASTIPFLLLAGLVRYRLLEVDVYVVRSIARAVLLLGALIIAAAATAVLDLAGGAAVGALLTVAAVMVGRPLLIRLERLADVVATGGRVRQGALQRDLVAELATLESQDLPRQACRLLASAMDIAWIRLTTADGTTVHGTPAGQPVMALGLDTPTANVGRLECGRRRGGWSRRQAALLRHAAGQLALLLREASLTRELREQISALESSRARLVQAEDAARRRMERDLHDGVQQQVVALLARVTVARAQSAPGSPVAATLDAAHDLAAGALTDLRTLVSGIAPAVLSDRGLVAAVESRSALLPIEVTVDADPRLLDERLEPSIEGAAYFVIAEALANVMKHAGVPRARVVVAGLPDCLRVAVVDDGNGGASESGGLRGLRDRVEALGGRFDLQAVPGIGTTVLADFPLP